MKKNNVHQVTLTNNLRGHPMFYKFQDDDAKLHNDKNFSYAHGGDPLGNFKRVAAIMALYPKMNWAQPEMVAEVYALKQLDAYLWLKSNGHIDKFEGVNGRLTDRTIYSMIQRCIESEKADTQIFLAVPNAKDMRKMRRKIPNGRRRNLRSR